MRIIQLCHKHLGCAECSLQHMRSVVHLRDTVNGWHEFFELHSYSCNAYVVMYVCRKGWVETGELLLSMCIVLVAQLPKHSALYKRNLLSSSDCIVP